MLSLVETVFMRTRGANLFRPLEMSVELSLGLLFVELSLGLLFDALVSLPASGRLLLTCGVPSTASC